MKKKIIIILSIILCISLLALMFYFIFRHEDEPVKESAVKFVDAPSSMVLGQMKTLTYVIESDEQYEVKFSSSDTAVASIDGTATVEAIKPGQTVISAEYGEDKAEFTLTVVKDDGIPQLLFSNYFGENNEATITIGDQLSFDAHVFYNGRNFYDGEIEYFVDKEDCALIDGNGTFSAKATGTVKVKVNATWRGIDSPLLSKEVVVHVIDDVRLLLNDGEMSNVKLYTKSTHGGKAYDKSLYLKANLYVNGVDMTEDATFSIVGDENVATYDAQTKTITANKFGTAKLVATYNDGTKTYEHSVEVIVERPVLEYSKNVYFSQVDGEIEKLDVMFGESVSLTDAYQGGTDKTGSKLTLNGNLITDFALLDNAQIQNDTITVYTDTCGVMINVTACYKVIKDANDLTSVYGNSDTSKITGYFLVANDIDAISANVQIEPVFSEYSKGSTFSGIFDGGGHTIRYGLNKGGLFGILNAATVKNASFVVGEVKTEGTTRATDLGMYAILAGYMYSSTIENIYATYDVEFTPNLTKIESAYYRYRGLGLFAASNVGTIKDVVLNLSKVNGVVAGEKMGYGVLFAPLNGSYYFGSSVNAHVVWGVKELCWYEASGPDGAKLAHAASDAGYTVPTGLNINTDPSKKRVTSLAGTYRYGTLAAMAGSVSKVGNFNITQSGVVWADD